MTYPLVQAPTRRPIEVREGLTPIYQRLGALAAQNSRLSTSRHSLAAKQDLARQVGILYRDEIATARLTDRICALAAADNTDGNLGTLSGTLVAQEALQLFRYQFPLFGRIHTDFSDEEIGLKQTLTTRIIVTPGAREYDPTINADGEPNGWRTVTAPQSTDAPINMDKLIGVPIRFGIDTQAATARKLFEEQAPAASYALSKYFVEKVYAVLTPANYNGYAAVSGPKVPTAYATFPKSALEFGRNALVDIQAAFDANEVPSEGRSVLLNSSYHGQLDKDPSLTYFAAQRAPEIVSGEGMLPMMAGFQPLKAPNLAATNATANLVGVALHKCGVVAASRLPSNYVEALGKAAGNGVTVVVTDPDTEISALLVQFVNHQSGYAQWLLCAILGAGVGDKRGGLCITSQ